VLLEGQTVRIADKSCCGGGVPAVDGFEIDDGGVAAKAEDVFADACGSERDVPAFVRDGLRGRARL
jgi:hypothetical protein